MKNNELLIDENIISEEEIAQIIRNVDDDFSLNFTIHDSNPRKDARSNGLIMPMLVGVVSLFTAAFFLFFFARSITQEIDTAALSSRTVISESEWVILEHYIQLSNRTISSKNREIEIYREQIAEYDQRLDSLRELIAKKREIDEVLDKEKISLAAQGKDTIEIQEHIAEIKREKIASLSPNMARDYSLSLNEVNDRIDTLLVEKSESERLLEEEIAQRDKLVDNYERLVTDRKESLESPVAKAEPIALAGPDFNSYDRYILGKYRTLFNMIANDDYEALSGEIREIRGILSDPDSPLVEDINESVLNVELSNLSLIGIMNRGGEDPAAAERTEKGEKILVLLDEMEQAAEQAVNSTDETVRQKAVRRLKSLVDTVPVLASALTLLASESAPAVPVAAAVTEAPSPFPYYLGTTSKVSFNLITIEADAGLAPTPGDRFAVYSREGAENGTELARGEITQAQGTQVKGRILSLTNTQSKPGENDPVYIISSGE